MRHIAIAFRTGRVKHLPVWHQSGRGAAALCNAHNAPASFTRCGAWQGERVLFDWADTIDKPWCKHCRSEVEKFVEALATFPVTTSWRAP